MILIPIILFILGVAIGVFIQHPIKGEFGVYVGVACLAGLDTVCGGIRSNLENKFDSGILTTGFVSNIFIAFGLCWLGDRIGAELYFVSALIFGQRIFLNLSVIRRLLLSKWRDTSDRKRSEKQALAQAQSGQVGDSVS